MPHVQADAHRAVRDARTYSGAIGCFGADLQHGDLSASDANFANPERGFYIQRAPLWRESERLALEAADLEAARAQGISLLRAYYVLERYRDRPLEASVFEALEADLNLLRAHGFKVILRFAYNFPLDGEDYRASVDAPVNVVLKHIQQLKPILRAHADIIAHMEAGFIGAWGEWHSSANQLIDHPERGFNASSRAILFALLDALPQERMIALRYPFMKQQLFGASPLTEAQAFTGSPQARLAAHDDCFLASAPTGGRTSTPRASPISTASRLICTPITVTSCRAAKPATTTQRRSFSRAARTRSRS